MSKINIQNLKVITCHGCFDEEKVNPQPFVFNCELTYDFEKAGTTDNLDYTLDYGEVMQSITDFAKENTFNLIETLCYRTASMIMQKYPVEAVKLEVKKPEAPVNLPFENVSVSTTLERKDIYLSLGSNLGDRKATLDFAIKRLGENPAIKIEKVSSYLENPPYGGVASLPFINLAVKINTYLSPSSLLEYLHKIEAEAHRERNVHWGDRTLDIDIVFYGNEIIYSNELTIPHADYHNRDFVLIPLNEIASDFVCPLYHKRIKDLLNELLSKKNN